MSFLPVTAPVWVQLHAVGGQCWSSSFWYPAKNDARQLVVDMVP
jgi:hypothetical protein